MTPVDLAEQLLAIGRQLQATERRLTRTSSKLELPPVLQQLLTDPMARLADMLQPLTNWPVPQPAALIQCVPRRPIDGRSMHPGHLATLRRDAHGARQMPPLVGTNHRGWPRLARRPDRSPARRKPWI